MQFLLTELLWQQTIMETKLLWKPFIMEAKFMETNYYGNQTIMKPTIVATKYYNSGINQTP